MLGYQLMGGPVWTLYHEKSAAIGSGLSPTEVALIGLAAGLIDGHRLTRARWYGASS